MHRFIAFFWNPEDLATSDLATKLLSQIRRSPTRWISRADSPGFAAFDSPRSRDRLHTYTLPNNSGAIFGWLFRTDSTDASPTAIQSLDENSSRRILDSHGCDLVSQYWGNYVAVLHDGVSQHGYLLRDCSGKIPCYTTRIESVFVAFSDASDVIGLTHARFCIDWKYLAAFVYFNDLELASTGLEQVEQLLAGQRLELTPGGEERSALWDPVRVCERYSIEDHDEAVAKVRQTTQTCINAWASAYTSILHSLSGGFDSSVVLACLSKAPTRPRTVCINRYHEVVGEDERVYARLAAKHCGMPLIEREWNPYGCVLDSALFSIPLTVRPTVAMIFEGIQARILAEIARSVDAEAIWTGQGGDHLFFQHKTPLTAADYLRRHGIGYGLMAAIRDAARLTELSYWDVLKEVIRPHNEVLKTRFKRPRWMPDHLSTRTTHFVNRQALPADPQMYVAHYWFDSVDSLPLGKQSQIFYLAEVLNRHISVPGLAYAEEHHPLLSQPLIELCLQIPAYLHVKGGYPRALAHDAFKDAIPPEIAHRRTKGATARLTTGFLHHSREFIRDLLLDGILAREGIIDRDQLNAPLAKGHPLQYKQLLPLLACISAEVWARQWVETPFSAVA